VDAVYNQLKGFHQHAKVWKKNDIPDQFHYKHNDRIAPIIIMPEVGWWLVQNKTDKIPLSKQECFCFTYI